MSKVSSRLPKLLLTEWLFDFARDFLRRLFHSYKLILSLIAAAIVLFIAAYFLANRLQVPVSMLVRDPVSVAGIPAYVGLFSNLGILLWTAAAATSLLGARLFQSNRSLSRFLLFGGLFSLWLAIDDQFLMHENFIPDVLGISEGYVYAIYLLVAGVFFVSFVSVIRSSTDYIFLAAALFFLAGSIGVDEILPITDTSQYLEECGKFIGIIFWAVYFVRTVLQRGKMEIHPNASRYRAPG